ncbi:hypothetical protein [Edaphobacter aggregans]|uniref:hypothetical protein n=1 Tax=Edaphobacter aggregans TaxID=570835 RepID=UPI000556D546|nr:hypothetical protein [Edaphobacter aggregans]
MKKLRRIILGLAIVCLMPTIPALAQIENGLDFTTSFPFYVGNAKMPAGSYKVTQADIDAETLLIESTNGSHSALIAFIPTQSSQPHAKSDVTFHKYGDTEYLNRLWVEGQKFGMKLEPTKVESKFAAKYKPVEHSVTGKKH